MKYMNYKIIVDSSCDMSREMREKLNVSSIPLSIYVGDHVLKDDDNLDTAQLLELMKKSDKAPRSASPSPSEFLKEYEGDESVFVVTVSSPLSATYNNAVLAKNIFLEGKKKFIHVFDSLSASVGITLISLKIVELVKQNLKELDIVEKVNEYIKEMKTLFLLESLDNLIKSGRINKILGKVITALSIKPIMGGSEDGNIKLFDKVRGSKRAFQRLIEMIGEIGGNLEDKILGIAHCNCLEKAEAFKREVLKRYNFKDIIIVEMGGLTTIYANEGGMVIAF